MSKGIQACTVLVLMMLTPTMSYTAELSIVPHKGINGALKDGVKVARGQIACRGAHAGFYVWMNAQQEGKSAERYIVRGSRDRQHQIRVRLRGEGWSPATEGQHGILRPDTDEQATFDVVIDGNQHVPSDDYIFSVGGACVNRTPQK